MRLSVKSVLAAAIMLMGVAACTPDGYVISPALASYFTSLVPAARDETISTVSVCSYNDTWYTTVLFDDGLLYHFSVNPDDSSIKLESWTTPTQRDMAKDGHGSSDLECIGSLEDTIFPWDRFKEGGSYRFEFRGHNMEAQVRKTIVIHDAFNDSIKKRLQNAARSIQMAVALHQRYVPAEKSWGVSP